MTAESATWVDRHKVQEEVPEDPPPAQLPFYEEYPLSCSYGAGQRSGNCTILGSIWLSPHLWMLQSCRRVVRPWTDVVLCHALRPQLRLLGTGVACRLLASNTVGRWHDFNWTVIIWPCHKHCDNFDHMVAFVTINFCIPAGTTKKLAQTLQAAGAPGTTWIIKSHLEVFGKFRWVDIYFCGHFMFRRNVCLVFVIQDLSPSKGGQVADAEVMGIIGCEQWLILTLVGCVERGEVIMKLYELPPGQWRIMRILLKLPESQEVYLAFVISADVYRFWISKR